MESEAEIAAQEESLMKKLAELRASKKKKISKACSSTESPRQSGRLQTKRYLKMDSPCSQIWSSQLQIRCLQCQRGEKVSNKVMGPQHALYKVVQTLLG
ncbi:unnamed protein product [Calypogeia fissa]